MMRSTKKYTEAQIEQIIKEYITEEFMYDQPDVVLSNDLPLIADTILESMGVVRLIRFLEEKFDLTLAPEEIILDNFKTINAIKSLVLTRL